MTEHGHIRGDEEIPDYIDTDDGPSNETEHGNLKEITDMTLDRARRISIRIALHPLSSMHDYPKEW